MKESELRTSCEGCAYPFKHYASCPRFRIGHKCWTPKEPEPVKGEL